MSGLSMSRRVAVIGGGAAGFFGAIRAAELLGAGQVLLLEATNKYLTKVKLSGGGRCKATHYCFDPKKLIENYPRGAKELLSGFHRFQPQDTIKWFANQGVELKREPDGRMFPTTDKSETIITALKSAAERYGVEIKTQASVQSLRQTNLAWEIVLKDGTKITAERVLLATGSAPIGHQLAESSGHTITDLAPSLFTFNIKDARIKDIPGISVERVNLKLLVEKKTFKREGPILITHWGVSGPAVLKLSAFAARELKAANYQAELYIDWLPHLSEADLQNIIARSRQNHAKQQIALHPIDPTLPKRLWHELVCAAGGTPQTTFADLSRTIQTGLVRELKHGAFQVTGKGVFKDEFVTAGGVKLSEVDFRTMESRVAKGLYFAGEILDIDGITGGFNFQAAWTTSWIAGSHMASEN